MSGRSAVSEVMDGVGPVSAVAIELKELETAMADPDRADEMDDIITRYGEVQARFEELDGYAPGCACARSVGGTWASARR